MAYGNMLDTACSIREEITLPGLRTRLEAMVNNSGASLALASEIRSRLCGSRPEPSSDNVQGRPAGNGMLEEMHLLIDALGQNLERLQDMQNATYSRIT